jgi:spore coat polysaccharide biosynthesis protein SpsF
MALDVLAILQARMSSTRLPEKVLADVVGAPMLARQIERIQRARRIDALCVATSTDASDDPIETLCVARGVRVSRGSLTDVLDRYYQAARQIEPRHVVRVTGDCPLIDPAVIDEVISTHVAGNFDYTSNTIVPTYPDGLDVEVFRFEALRRAWSEAKLASQREHVTPFIKLQPALFRLGEVRNVEDLSALRWTVDYAGDLAMVRHVYAQLYPARSDFSMQDILALLHRRPDIAALSTNVERDEGYKKSLASDHVV